jgi:hypothetical protein
LRGSQSVRAERPVMSKSGRPDSSSPYGSRRSASFNASRLACFGNCAATSANAFAIA